MRLIIPMGGRGTRLRPFSHTTPKALLPVAGRPAVARSLGAWADALPRPVCEVVFVLSPADRAGDVPRQLEAACRPLGVEVAFAVQSSPLGTAHAFASAGDKLDGEVLTVWSDTLFQAARRATLDGAPDVVAWTIDVPDPRRFGVVVRDDDGRAVGLLEKPPDARFTETLIGAYYLREAGHVRETIADMMGRGQTGAGGEYQWTDALDAVVRGGARLATEPVSEWLDVGTVPAYLDAVARVLDREGHSPDPRPGVTIRPPVYLAPDAIVERSTVGPYASVEARARISDAAAARAVVFEDASVSESQLDGAVLGRRARVSGWAGTALLGDDGALGTEVSARPPTA